MAVLFLESQIWDQRWELELSEDPKRTGMLFENNCIARYFRRNYHFTGFLKKLILFAIIIIFDDRWLVQLWIIHFILGLRFLMGVLLRPHRTRVLNFFKSLSDMLLVVYFVLIHEMDRCMRQLDNLSEAELKAVTEEKLVEVAESQKRIGYIGIGFQLAFCVVNAIIFCLRFMSGILGALKGSKEKSEI